MQPIFEIIQDTALLISDLLINGESGYSDSSNATGDQQLKLDLQSDILIEAALKPHPKIKALISEEKDEVMPCNENGTYTVCYDPLDGSSIIDADLAVGSIFGIYKGEPSGDTLVASAYVIYGPRIEMVTVLKEGEAVRLRYSDARGWQMIGTLKLNEKGKLNASGATQKGWSSKHREFIRSLFDQGYRLRYSGGMVPDLHQILVKGGGLFSYPGTSDKPNGKLRMLFEVLPFALIYESAGGEAIDDKGRRLLDLSAPHPHATTPCFFGSKFEINSLKKAYGIA